MKGGWRGEGEESLKRLNSRKERKGGKEAEREKEREREGGVRERWGYTVLKIIMQLFYKALNCVKQKTCTKTNAHWFDRKLF